MYSEKEFSEPPTGVEPMTLQILVGRSNDWAISPVPELSFLPSPYRGWTRAGERRVQDNLHAHAQNAAIFPPNRGENHIW